MKKAFYSLTNLSKDNEKITGVGYIADNQLITWKFGIVLSIVKTTMQKNKSTQVFTPNT